MELEAKAAEIMFNAAIDIGVQKIFSGTRCCIKGKKSKKGKKKSNGDKK